VEVRQPLTPNNPLYQCSHANEFLFGDKGKETLQWA
jgi:hypothetical protein